jgi:hypothetical protein
MAGSTKGEQRIRERLLHTMYKSVHRMNWHVIKGRMESASVEQHLQRNLRNNFKQLDNENS